MNKRIYRKQARTLHRLDEVKAYFREYRAEHHYSPTYAEISAKLNVSISTVAYYISSLKAENWFYKTPFNAARTLVPLEEGQNETQRSAAVRQENR